MKHEPYEINDLSTIFVDIENIDRLRTCIQTLSEAMVFAGSI